MLKTRHLDMVEAPGVEPGSENVTGKETTCLVRSCFRASTETFAAGAQNGQETQATSPGISPPALGPHAGNQPANDVLRWPAGPASEDGYLTKLSSVCQFLVGNCCFALDFGCVHPGMPLNRKHFRRSRDAPMESLRAIGW